jgi:hypothetical protein
MGGCGSDGSTAHALRKTTNNANNGEFFMMRSGTA